LSHRIPLALLRTHTRSRAVQPRVGSGVTDCGTVRRPHLLCTAPGKSAAERRAITVQQCVIHAGIWSVIPPPTVQIQLMSSPRTQGPLCAPSPAGGDLRHQV